MFTITYTHVFSDNGILANGCVPTAIHVASLYLATCELFLVNLSEDKFVNISLHDSSI